MITIKNTLFGILSLSFIATIFSWQTALAETYSTQLAPPLIEVSGEGTAFAQPNEAQLAISFSESNLKLETARQQVGSQVNDLLNVLDRFELDTSSLDTSNTNIQPRYEYRNNGQREFIGYQVNRTVSFTLINLSQLDKLVKSISEEQITRLDYIRFTHSNPEKLRQEALDKAIQNSKELANHIADSYNAEIERIYRVNYQSYAPQPRPQVMAMRAEMSDASSNYAQKDLEFKVNIQAAFKLK